MSSRETWKRRLEHLEEELAKCSDPIQRFTIEEAIKEAKGRIGQPSATPAPSERQVETKTSAPIITPPERTRPVVSLVRVFVSSPGDCSKERAVLDDAVRIVNETAGRDRGVRLETFRWENDVIPRIGKAPQDEVDHQTPYYDIYLGILSGRFGTPTGETDSGTEKEFRDALERYGKTGKPWILFYFNDAPALPRTSEEVAQYGKVVAFREQLQGLGILGRYKGVRGANEAFFDQVFLHLQGVVREIVPVPSSPGGASEEKAEPEDTVSLIVPPAYREWLRGECDEMGLLGLELKEGMSVCLRNVYVPLTTLSLGELEGQSKKGSEELAGLEGEREKPNLLLDELSKESLYVPGAPGSGKSTFCRWVAWLACVESIPEVGVPAPKEYREGEAGFLRGRLALIVPLRELWTSLPKDPGRRALSCSELESGIQRWMEAKEIPGLSFDLVVAHLDAGSAMLMFDGVDEVPITEGEGKAAWSPRESLLAGLREVIRHWGAKDNRILVTSRPYGLKESDRCRLELREAPINGLDETLQGVLVRRWFQALSTSGEDVEATAGEMIEHVRARPEIAPLCGSPMLLTAMCVIYRQGKRLPEDKYELYERIVENVLYNRLSGEEIAPVRGRLSVIAYGMHTGSGLDEERETPQAEVTYEEIEQVIRRYRDESGDTEPGYKGAVEAREHLLSRSGLLLPRDRRRASFYHLSIQEFLAATRHFDVEGLDLFDAFRCRSPAAEWRNTLTFIFGGLLHRSMTTERAVRLLSRMIEESRGDEVGLRAVAALCLPSLKRRGSRLKESVEEKFRKICLRAIEDEVSLQDRFVLGIALGQLGDPRILDPGDPEGFVEIPAGQYFYGDERKLYRVDEAFLLARYPVTNSQFAVFVEAGGYENREFWSAEGRMWLDERGEIEPKYWKDGRRNAPNQPVVGVSYWEAEAFASWAGARLPNGMEWEAAARGPEGLVYPWGRKGDWEDGICNSSKCGLGVTSPVGLFPRSRSRAFGLEDLAGNVWEWSVDQHETSYGHERVLRGGSWYNRARVVRSASRSRYHPANRRGNFGFRLARGQSSCKKPEAQKKVGGRAGAVAEAAGRNRS